MQRVRGEGSFGSLRSGLLAVVVAGVFVASAFASGEARAAEPWGLGVRVGGVYSQLNRPTDPKGAPTLLYGSAFTGTGLTLGATGRYTLAEPGGVALQVDGGVFYATHRGEGYVELRDAGESRRITLTAHVLRVPVLLRGFKALGAGVSVWGGVGPELLAGLGAKSEVEQEGVDGAPPTLAVKRTTHLGLTGALGVGYEIGGVRVPLELRVTWDPAVPGSTKERFDGYVSVDETGAYQVAFDWQVAVMVGVEFL